jgi:two-component system, response regulator PdtaR
MQEEEAVDVLLVDDDPILRLDMADRLRCRGYRVLRVGSAQQAISIMEKHPSVQAVFSDLEMPGMSGLELLHLISGRWPGRRLVLISGWSAPSQHDMPAGAQYAQKPVSDTTLDSMLSELPARRDALPKEHDGALHP